MSAVSPTDDATGNHAPGRPALLHVIPARAWDVLWLSILALYVLAGTSLVPFHGDESTQIYMSRDYAYQFMQHDLSLIYYSETPVSETEQQLRLLNGTLAKYSIGLAWQAAGFTLDDINEQWDWGADWDYNQQYGHAPTPDLLLVARWSSALFTAGSVALMFIVGLTVYRRPGAYVASLIYALNPAVLLNGRRAMMEGSLLFFMLLALLAGIAFMQRPSWRRAIGLGVASGLAIASKHPALYTVGTVFAACAGYVVIDVVVARIRAQRAVPLQDDSPHGDSKPQNVLRIITQLALAGALMIGVFILCNPAWWGASPIQVGSTVLDLRENLLQIQVDSFGGYATLPDKIAGLFRNTVIVAPQYYEVDAWADYIAGEIGTYESSPWRGVSVGLLGGFSGLAAVLWAGILGIGAWRLLRDRQIAPRLRWLLGVWIGGSVGLILLLTPLDWQRYYLPAYPAVSLLAMMGLVWLGRHLIGRTRPIPINWIERS